MQCACCVCVERAACCVRTELRKKGLARQTDGRKDSDGKETATRTRKTAGQVTVSLSNTGANTEMVNTLEITRKRGHTETHAHAQCLTVSLSKMHLQSQGSFFRLSTEDVPCPGNKLLACRHPHKRENNACHGVCSFCVFFVVVFCFCGEFSKGGWKRLSCEILDVSLCRFEIRSHSLSLTPPSSSVFIDVDRVSWLEPNEVSLLLALCKEPHTQVPDQRAVCLCGEGARRKLRDPTLGVS